MQPILQPTFAERLSGLWSTFHSKVEFTVSESEVHYLRTLAVAVDDDLVSYLLLKKLRLAKAVPPADLPPGTAVMHSFVEFSFDGGEARFVQIVHPPSPPSSYGLSVTSRLGAGLIGLRRGQTILWPDAEGNLCDLYVAHVESGSGLPRAGL